MLTDLEEPYSQQRKFLDKTTNKKNLGYYEFYKIIGEYSQVESVESEEQYTTKLGKIVNLKQIVIKVKQILNNEKDLLIIKLPTCILYCFETNDQQFPIFRLNFVVKIYLTNLRNLKTKEMLNGELQKKNSKSFYGFFHSIEENQENENEKQNENEKDKEQKKPKHSLNLMKGIFLQISNKNLIQNILESLKKDKNEEQISINYHIKDHSVNQDSILDMFDSKNEIENNSGNNFFLSDEISNNTKKNFSKTKNKNKIGERKKKNNNNN
ncbi:hypothetical protein M0812_12528 [Anaeramoeba flamelloides]|uniref:Uncharacterized protein n=1 Tax=Anaeramoeba flamelloides TaxID=1746091 RepID=A0AAV7ZLB7_9EUKA|nr:hypothetical protein M0812_12528 [Anaeramoeba flamelloides]